LFIFSLALINTVAKYIEKTMEGTADSTNSGKHVTKGEKHNAPVTGHKTINILAIVCLIFCYFLTITFNALSGSGSSVFKNTIGELSDEYHLNTTPAGWTFIIWSIIYLFMAMAFIFFIITMFKQNHDGYIYLNPVVVSPTYCAVYGINFLLNIAWLFLWDREVLAAASTDLFAIFITNVISLVILIKNIEREDHLLKKEQPRIYWTYIILAVNGQALYCTWTFFASLLNFSICLVYVGDASLKTAADVNLSLVLIIVLSWVAVDIIYLDQFTRYLVSPYLVVVWALGGVISEQSSDGDIHESTKNFTGVLMGIAISVLVGKIATTIFRKLKQPYN